MSEQTQHTAQQQPGRQPKDDGCPPPPPPPCPDPCDQERPWGPPKIRSECCLDDRKCCPDGKNRCCNWDDVDDPCVRAASADCGGKWTKIKCKCESSNEECKCDAWDCCCYPQGTCVPCEPCDGLIPTDTGDPGGCDDPDRQDCNSDELRRQLDALKKCISSQTSEQAKIAAEIKARQERQTELDKLITAFDGIVEKYKTERHKLICREDCLKGFHRDMTKVFQDKMRFPDACLTEMQTAINTELCILEKEKCCQKNLEGKLSKFTKLIWEQMQADLDKAKAIEAFQAIQDLPKWMGDQFAALEALKDKIAQALNDKDREVNKWAFYLFYWQFVPALCKCFKVAICCKKKEGEQYSSGNGEAAVHIGCHPGDWHPSQITVETLKKLICCTWDFVRAAKEAAQAKAAAVQAVKDNLAFITAKAADDAKTLDARIKARLEKVSCNGSHSAR
jgi:hypothetical protein